MSESSNTNSATTIAQLEAKVAELVSYVEKQSKLIATTGQKVLDLEVKDIKTKLNSANTPQSSTKLNLDDYITNEDIVQLVTELQSSLDKIEERSTVRLFNNSTVKEDSDIIEVITNKDGDTPDLDTFPHTLGEFKKLNNVDLIQLGLFYEIITPPQIKDVDLITNPETKPSTGALKNHIDEILVNFTDEDYIDVFDDLARNFGITYRKSK
ncbi:uncharacterized protein RJT21DRAFT_47835 [Scheffersomyces amazonensis]|uniref:uncharacterized protein n=1 Tax=Scheffersomyces amazonensis TaxID=1078765 RepID=UPI00315C7C56